MDRWIRVNEGFYFVGGGIRIKYVFGFFKKFEVRFVFRRKV